MNPQATLDLNSYENSLQQESEEILKKINLVPLLQKYGNVNIVGGKALGLMIAKDIDISVVVEKVSISDWQEIVRQLMITPHVRKVTAIDFYNYNSQHIYDPENGEKYSLYISVDTLMGFDNDKYDTWECQIHLIEKDKFDITKFEDIKNRLNADNREIILNLKYWAHKVNKILLGESGGHFKIYSPSIYEAVLNNRISTPQQFIEYFKKLVPEQYNKLFISTINKVAE